MLMKTYLRRTNMTKETKELEEKMAYCYGSEHYYRGQLLPFLYTDGVRTFVQNAGGGAYWFLMECARIAKDMKDFGSIVLDVKGSKADILVDGKRKKHISYTDCPDGEWTFYYSPEDNVLLWRGEY